MEDPFKVPETPKTPRKKIPKQLSGVLETSLRDGLFVQAIRTISLIIAGKYVPRRSLYADLWHYMLSARLKALLFVVVAL